jgi:hypothetical protein
MYEINNEEQSLQEIVDKGEALYEAVKDQYEPEHKGKFLAIEVESGNFYMGDNSMIAVEKARAANPEKLVYLKKIGFSATDILASSFMSHP